MGNGTNKSGITNRQRKDAERWYNGKYSKMSAEEQGQERRSLEKRLETAKEKDPGGNAEGMIEAKLEQIKKNEPTLRLIQGGRAENQEQGGAWWDSRFIGRRIDELEKAYNNARSVSGQNRVAMALLQLDKTITSQMQDPDNLQAPLLTHRRRVRQLLRKLNGGKNMEFR